MVLIRNVRFSVSSLGGVTKPVSWFMSRLGVGALQSLWPSSADDLLGSPALTNPRQAVSGRHRLHYSKVSIWSRDDHSTSPDCPGEQCSKALNLQFFLYTQYVIFHPCLWASGQWAAGLLTALCLLVSCFSFPTSNYHRQNKDFPPYKFLWVTENTSPDQKTLRLKYK